MSVLNLKYYKEDDYAAYFSLKKIDESTINLIKNSDNQENFNKIPVQIRYFLNSKKSNLLNWYEFKPEDKVLIINDCFGYVAEGICGKVSSVSILETSKTIAEITDSRLSGKDNVEIFVGDILNVTFTDNFDYIVVIDTLESKNTMFTFKDPYWEFFEYLGYFLKDDGKLVFVMPNRFGLKNWVGAFNELTGDIFTDIDIKTGRQLTLYTKDDYERILKALKYEIINTYYPIPHHYAPERILSEEELNNASIEKYFQNYALYSEKLFNESFVVKDLIESKKFDLFANSYMFFAQRSKKEVTEW